MSLCPACNSPTNESHRFCPDCGFGIQQGPKEDADPFIGMTIDNKFKLRELIGSGGMGNVYLADQQKVGRTVAVKIMHRHLLGDERAAARFITEARAASQLNHPHSISVLHFGQTNAGILYMVMEYLRGKSLDTVLDDEFPIPFARVANILCQVMDAVDAAHHLNIIHRDLKPENIFLENTMDQDFVKVLDFGVAKMLERKDSGTITSPGLVPGTPEYMSPEQARGGTLDPRSDVYSMGVILYEMLTDSVPFKGKSALETMMSHVQDQPIPPSERRPDRNIPKAMDTIVLWALTKTPSERISSAAQFRDVLSAWAEVSGIWPGRKELEAAPPVGQARVLEEFLTRDELKSIDDGMLAEEEKQAVDVSFEAVRRLRTDAHLAITRGTLLGRDRELGILKRFMASKKGRAIRIEAPPGSGKSRLVQECIRKARKEGRDVIHCTPDAGWAAITLMPMQTAAARCLSLSLASCRYEDSVRRATEPLGVEEEDLPGLFELFCIDTSDEPPVMEIDERRRERAVALRNLTHCAAAQKPTLMVFEDVDQYDLPSQELVAWLAASQEKVDLKLVITHSPRYLQLWSENVKHLEVADLEEQACNDLLKVMLEQEDPALAKRCIGISGGNPLFLIQLVYADIFEGIWQPPPKLVDLVVARMERVSQKERELLQWLSVLNDWVTTENLYTMGGGDLDPTLLDNLVDRGYLQSHSGGYTFVHRIVAMAVYSTIPAEVRRRLHDMVAAHLRTQSMPDTTVAFHSHEAEDGPRAMKELMKAGSLAVRGLDPKSAVQWFSKAIETVRKEWGKGRIDAYELDNMAVDLAHRLAMALREIGDTQTARGILEETLSVSAGEAASRAALRLELGRIDQELGQLQRASRQLQLARADAESAGADPQNAEIARQLARVVGLLGRKEEASRLLMESVSEEANPDGVSWTALLESATICSRIGLPDRARGFLLDAFQQAESERSTRGKLRILLLMAEIHKNSQEWNMAEMRLSQAQALIEKSRIGDRTLATRILIEQGRIRRIQGDEERGRELLQKALKLAHSIGYWEGIKRTEDEIVMLKYAKPKQL